MYFSIIVMLWISTIGPVSATTTIAPSTTPPNYVYSIYFDPTLGPACGYSGTVNFSSGASACSADSCYIAQVQVHNYNVGYGSGTDYYVSSSGTFSAPICTSNIETKNVYNGNVTYANSVTLTSLYPTQTTCSSGYSLFGNFCGACSDDLNLSSDGKTCSLPVNTPDSTKSQGKPDCSVGNPCNAGTGNKYQHEADYTGIGIYPLHAERVYNSGAGTPSAVATTVWGYQWRGFYDRSITYNSNGTSLKTASLLRPDGKTYYFNQAIGTATPPLTTTTWTPDADVVGTLVETGVDSSGNPMGWTYTNELDEIETYNATGQLVSITNRASQTQTLTYSCMPVSATCPVATPTTIAPAAGLLITVTDPAGRQLNYFYGGSSRVIGMTDPAGNVYAYAYNANNNLSTVTYPDGKVRSYLYGETANVSPTPNTGVSYAHSLTGIVDENGSRYASWIYDAAGRAISSEHGAMGSGIDHVGLVYGTPTNGVSATTVTDSLGIARTYNFSTLLSVVKNTGITGQPCNGCSTAFTYDANGNVSSRTDFKGNVTTYQYDLTRNLETSRTEASGSTVARTITTQWHPTLRLPTQIAEPGRTTAYTYDSATNNLLTRTVTDTASGKSRTWTYTYTTSADSTLPNLVKTIKGPRTDVSSITTLGYYLNGDLKTITDALGHVTTITSYDGAGRPLSITDANSVVTSLSYTPRGWLASRTVGALITLYSYDGAGQITRVTLPDGSHLDYTYDAAHRLTDIADAKLDHTHYTLDNAGNRTREDVYDPAGNLSKTHSRVFDSLNRLAQDISAYNATTSYTTNFTYDANGNLTKTLDANNNATLYGYDALNRISQMTDAALGVTQYAYNALDQLNGVTDPKSFNTQYGVNALGDQTQLVSPDSGTTNRSFDSAGNLAGATDARGIAATYAYDALNRPVSVSFPATGENITYTWDAATGCSYGVGRLCQVMDADGTTVFAYDNQGNLILKTRTELGVNFMTHYVYDAANRLITVMTPTGETLSMPRDTAGQVQQVTDTNSGGSTMIAANIQYDGTGQATSALLGDGVTQTEGYTLSGQTSGATAVRPLNPADIDASTVSLFLSGSYVKQTLLEPILIGLYQPGTMSVFYDGTVNGGIGAASGENYRAYFGIANTSAQNAAIPASLSGQKVLVIDRSLGDSTYAIAPVALASPISAMSLDGSCAQSGHTDAFNQWLWACPNTVNRVPDAGLSDEEPAVMESAINMWYDETSNNYVFVPPFLKAAQQANLASTAVVGQVMGVIVNGASAQGSSYPATAAMLSLSQPQITGLLGGTVNDWNMIDSGIPAGSTTMVVCRRQAGSGVQAAVNAYLFFSPCSYSAAAALTFVSSSILGSPSVVGAGNIIVVENASPDAVANCMNVAQTGTGNQAIDASTGAMVAQGSPNSVVLPPGNYAIGVMSLNRPARTGEMYQFVAIDGNAPTLQNASLGMYDMIVESVMTSRNATVGGIPPLAGGQLDLFNTLAASAGNPVVLGGSNGLASAIPGVAALSENQWVAPVPFNTGYPVLRVGNSGNTCAPLEQLQ